VNIFRCAAYWNRSIPRRFIAPALFDGGVELFTSVYDPKEKYMKGDKGEVAFWQELMSHGTWDAFWKARDILPHLRNIKPAVMVVGGWFDTENLYGALKI
jgi:predicted acyl esterase